MCLLTIKMRRRQILNLHLQIFFFICVRIYFKLKKQTKKNIKILYSPKVFSHSFQVLQKLYHFSIKFSYISFQLRLFELPTSVQFKVSEVEIKSLFYQSIHRQEIITLYSYELKVSHTIKSVNQLLVLTFSPLKTCCKTLLFP